MTRPGDSLRFLPVSTQRRLIPRSLWRQYGIERTLPARLPAAVAPVICGALHGAVIHLLALTSGRLLCRRTPLGGVDRTQAAVNGWSDTRRRCPACEQEALERWGQ
jgi:hypothetical protein